MLFSETLKLVLHACIQIMAFTVCAVTISKIKALLLFSLCNHTQVPLVPLNYKCIRVMVIKWV